MTKAALSVAHNLINELGEQGYVPYRTHLHFMDDVAGHLSFNDGAYHRFLGKIKDAVDPRGILSPGRYGVWGSQGSERGNDR
jgi:4-cresol dehydrogenase (hydroxylating)